MDVADDEVAALLALLRHRRRGASWGTIASEVVAEGSALRLLRQDDPNALLAAQPVESMLEREYADLAAWRAAGHRLVTVLERSYPQRLRDIRESPPFLFYNGELLADDEGMSVVGSRRASRAGQSMAEAVAELLVSEGLTVVSGLASGIDAAAHRAALECGGRTVALIGTGITHAYPKENSRLQMEIAHGGLVLSQFFPDASPTRQYFPMRNAVMSGYGLATIIIEAGEYSGSRIQARLAGEHGRPVILTSRVVKSTSWASGMVGAPNVTVVENLAEMRTAIRKIRSLPFRLDAAIRALVAS